MSLAETVEAGDRLKSLRALRDRLAAAIDASDSARDVASLSQRLMDALAQIAEVEKAQPAEKGTPLDELANRRPSRPTPRARRAPRSS